MPLGSFDMDVGLNNAFWLIPAIFVLLLLFSALRILREYERGVVFQLGRFWKVKGPGLILVIPVIQQMVQGRPAHPGLRTCRPRT